jgi:hypothetical protein
MPAAAEIQIKGLRELQRASKAAGAATHREVRKALGDAAGPVRERAEQLAQSQIRNVGAKWSRMRIGVTVRSVYVAPAARRSGGSPRPNMGGLLLSKSMMPALDEKTDEVMREFEHALDNIADIWERKP